MKTLSKFNLWSIEGRSSRDFKQTLALLYRDPVLMHVLLKKLSEAVLNYLEEQAKSGVNVVMLFDTWGGILTTANYQIFSLHYMKEIIQTFKNNYPTVPVIMFTKGGGQWLKSMCSTGCDALGLDWSTDLKRAREEVGNQVALQGNLDPAALRAKPEIIAREVAQVLEAFGPGEGHIFNLGHGITPDIPPEHVKAMLDAVSQYSPAYHQNS